MKRPGRLPYTYSAHGSTHAWRRCRLRTGNDRARATRGLFERMHEVLLDVRQGRHRPAKDGAGRIEVFHEIPRETLHRALALLAGALA